MPKNEQPTKDFESSFTAQPTIDIEKAILGSLLVSPGYNTLLSVSKIKEQHFYTPEDRQVFRAIIALVERGASPDMMLAYQQDSKLDPVYLADLCKGACFPSQLEYYISVLAENYHRRSLEYALKQAQIEIAAGQERVEIQDRLVTSLSREQAEETTTIIDEGYDVQELLAGRQTQSGVKSGIEELDLALAGGIMRSEMCIAAARTSIGKSALAVLWMIAAVLKGWPVLYFSYEMPRKQIWHRILSYWSGVRLRKFRQGSFDYEDRLKINNAHKELTGFWQHIRVNTMTNKPQDLRQLIRLEKMRLGDMFVIIDHAGRMKADGKASNSYERMSGIANGLKDIALDTNVPMLVLWQLSRAVEKDGRENKKPQLSDLRNTGEAEEVADEILLLSRDDYYDKSIHPENAIVTIDEAKARDGGRLGLIKIPWLDIISHREVMREPGED